MAAKKLRLAGIAMATDGCCRRMLLTTVETIQQVIPFYEAMHKRNQEVQSELE